MKHQISASPIIITGTGLWTPEHIITNEELVDSYNDWAQKFNADHAAAITAGEMEEKPLSSARFIEKASGIKSRYVYEKEGILDIDRMRPRFTERPESAISRQAEIGIAAARMAMAAAKKTASDIDAVIVACTYTERAYPAIAIEIQEQLGINGFGFDMLGACSAATFGLHRAYDCLASGSASCVLAVNPELVTPQVNFQDRDSHFIFGDVATAVILERAETRVAENYFQVLGTKALTRFSSHIRSNFGHLSRATDVDPYGWDKLFHQAGRKVFEEVSPIAAQHLADHLASLGIRPADVRRFWLHQANMNMNKMVIRQLLGEDVPLDKTPFILDRYGNTASAGLIIAFHLTNTDLNTGDIGVICSFGAGYSVGSLVLRKGQ
ncbi:MAG: beta-ketoacyl-ACP synthase III [Desulfobacterales bacterium CG23_combo_of_CG06-09_8_20_14_all_51_8]|nr:MAG: beta-ketoacyl-ACP synthase III [Desulfobacterales bacterium CG23_combo_of_CG06-09_8_20_14_all_51_8]